MNAQEKKQPEQPPGPSPGKPSPDPSQPDKRPGQNDPSRPGTDPDQTPEREIKDPPVADPGKQQKAKTVGLTDDQFLLF